MTRIDKNWQNWQELARIDQNWQELIRIDKNWQELTKIDKNWQELTRIDKIWQEMLWNVAKCQNSRSWAECFSVLYFYRPTLILPKSTWCIFCHEIPKYFILHTTLHWVLWSYHFAEKWAYFYFCVIVIIIIIVYRKGPIWQTALKHWFSTSFVQLHNISRVFKWTCIKQTGCFKETYLRPYKNQIMAVTFN